MPRTIELLQQGLEKPVDWYKLPKNKKGLNLFINDAAAWQNCLGADDKCLRSR
jgi:hypothetical protein